MSDEPLTASAVGDQNSIPLSDDTVLREIGRNFVESGHYHQNVADRTGDLMLRAHEIASELHRASIVRITEPDTGVDAFAVLSPTGGMTPLPESYFDEYRNAPKRRTGNAQMTRIESFIGHVNRFKSSASALFAKDDMQAPKLVSVLNYHEAVNHELGDGTVQLGDADLSLPDFGDHTATFAFPLSEEWKAWVAKNGPRNAMNNIEFAEFLEERFVDIEHVTDPSSLNDDIRKAIGESRLGGLGTPNDLFKLTDGLTIHESVIVGSHTKLSNGAHQLILKSDVAGAVDRSGEPVDVPSVFIITIPVFARSQDFYRIAVRLRTRTTGGLKFFYELWGIDRVFELAFTDACERARKETGLPLFYGNPE